MLWEMGMLATFIENYLVICNLFNGVSWEDQTLEEENSSGKNYEGVRHEVNAPGVGCGAWLSSLFICITTLDPCS